MCVCVCVCVCAFESLCVYVCLERERNKYWFILYIKERIKGGMKLKESSIKSLQDVPI